MLAGVLAALAICRICPLRPVNGLYADDRGIAVLLGEFAFPNGDGGPGESAEALGVEFVTGDLLFLQKSEHNLPKSGKTLLKMRARGLRPPHFSEHGHHLSVNFAAQP